jgi:hypothetical protein
LPIFKNFLKLRKYAESSLNCLGRVQILNKTFWTVKVSLKKYIFLYQFGAALSSNRILKGLNLSGEGGNFKPVILIFCYS